MSNASISPSNRYTTTYTWGKVSFTLTDFSGTEDDAQLLLMRIFEQSVRDLTALKSSSSQLETEYFQTAYNFIFNDKYRIEFGTQELSLEEILGLLGIDIDWFRRKARERMAKRNND